MQVMLGGSFAPPLPDIGAAYEGGFFAGQINVSGTKYNLVVSPKASGQGSNLKWGVNAVSTGATSLINGPANSALLASLGPLYECAKFCEDLNIGGYSDWYMPAKNELEVLYYFLKPTTDTNYTSSGSNANAVSPEPVNTNYSSGSPAQTSATGVTGFRTGEANAFPASATDNHYNSTETSLYDCCMQLFIDGHQYIDNGKQNLQFVRAVRRVPA